MPYPEIVIRVAWWFHLLCIMGPVALCFALWGLLPRRRRCWCLKHKGRTVVIYVGLLCATYQAWADKVPPDPPEPAVEFVFQIYKDLNFDGVKVRPVLWQIKTGD